MNFMMDPESETERPARGPGYNILNIDNVPNIDNIPTGCPLISF